MGNREALRRWIEDRRAAAAREQLEWECSPMSPLDALRLVEDLNALPAPDIDEDREAREDEAVWARWMRLRQRLSR